MPKVVYNQSQGLVQQAGSGFEVNTDTFSVNTTQFSMTSLPFSPVRDITGNQNAADVAVTSPGVYKFASAFAHSASLPLASAFPGATFVFRAGGALAFALTGSAEAGGTKVFAGQLGVNGGTQNAQGSKLTLAAVAGSSVSLISDGVNYSVLATSGTITITGA
jgi:hypothetical protein